MAIGAAGKQQMEEQEVIRALESGINPDATIRQQGEAYLHSLQGTPGFLQLLILIATSEHPLGTRQMASIILKNMTKEWADEKREVPIPPDDKNFIKSHVVQLLSKSLPEKIRSQFEELVYQVFQVEFPWPGLVDSIKQGILAEDQNIIYGALSAILQVSRVFEFKMNEKRDPLNQFMLDFSEALEQILGQLLANLQQETYQFICLILRIYWTVTYIDIPEQMAQSEVLSKWLHHFYNILSLDLGELEDPLRFNDDQTIIEELPAWQSKRWAAQNVHRLFHRYHDIHYLRPKFKAIGDFFVNNSASHFLVKILELFLQYGAKYTPNIVLNYYIKYIGQAIKVPQTVELVRQHMDTIVTQKIIPIIRRVPYDEQLWNENSIEFVRRETDLCRAYYSAKTAAVTLVHNICEDGFLQNTFNFISQSINQANLLDKEALLLLFGSLYEQLNSSQILQPFVVPFLSNYILPEFNSEVGFLRMRACWCYARYAITQFDDANHQTQVVQHICRLMTDKELPVRVEAATALPKLLGWPVTTHLIQGEIQKLLEIYLGLMNELDSEELVDSLEAIVEKFGSALAPYSYDLVNHLVGAFFRMSEKDANNDDGESAMAAISTLNTLGKIVDAVQKMPEVMQRISVLLEPVLDHTLGPKGSEYFEEGLNIIASMLYYSPDNALPNLFKFTQHLSAAIIGTEEVKPYGLENLEDVFSPLANFLQKYNDLCIQHITSFTYLADTLLQKGFNERLVGVKLYIAIIENSAGKVDQLLPQIFSTAITGFANSTKIYVKVLYVQVICVGLWYNPALTLQLMAPHNALYPILQFLFENPNKFQQNFAASHVSFGLTSLINQAEQLPQELFALLPNILKTIVAVLTNLYNDSLDENEQLNLELQPPTQQEYQNLMNKLSQHKNLDDDDNDEPWLYDGDDLYTSPFETMSESLTLKGTLEGIHARNQALSQHIQSILTPDDMAKLQKWFTTQDSLNQLCQEQSQMVVFRIKYKTVIGESLIMVGGSEELGNWNPEDAVLMAWDNNWWYADVPLSNQVEYKYIVHNHHSNHMRWEESPNRFYHESLGEEVVNYWESVSITFRLFWPSTYEFMYLSGDLKALGQWNAHYSLQLSLGEQERELPNGQRHRCYEKSIIVNWRELVRDVRYQYLVREQSGYVWEHDQSRYIKALQEPYTDMVILDFNFVHRFQAYQVTDSLLFGPMPQMVTHIEELAKHGVTKVISLQTDEDVHKQGTDKEVMRQMFLSHGIMHQQMPIQDFNPKALKDGLPAVVDQIDSDISSGQTIYVHCTAGIMRAPSSVLLYLVTKKNMPYQQAYEHIKSLTYHALPQHPNLDINTNSKNQNQNIKISNNHLFQPHCTQACP